MGCAMRKGCMLYLLLLCLIFSVTAGAAEIRVPDDYASIQEAIDAADYGDIIQVAQGVYKENLVFYLKFGVTLNGGYSSNYSHRDPSNYVTVIDGGKVTSTVIFYLTGSNTIDGFTIQNGLVEGGNGGGLYCYQSDPSISNNVITNNKAISSGSLGTGLGGGIYVEASAPHIIDNIISSNETSGDTIGGGGGIALYYADPETIIKGNTITKNTAGGNGGGIYILSADPHIIENSINDNQATDFGGGIAAYETSAIIDKNDLLKNKALLGGGLLCTGSEDSPVFINNNIIGNQASDGGGVAFFKADGEFRGNVVKDNNADRGGGIYCVGLIPAISNSVIAENYAEQGGGILCAGSSPTITNSVIAGNVAAKDGAAMHCMMTSDPDVLSSPIFKNCTFVRNQAKKYGNINLFSSSNLQVSNSIFWENQGDFILETTAQATIAYTHINEPRYKGTSGNIFKDPLFVDLEAGDYTLDQGSPCLDAGDPSVNENDPDGTRNDMGAFGGPGAADWTGGLTLVPVSKIKDDAWNNLGPYGGQITSIAIDPMNPEKMFAATYQGDGLFVSKDRGTTWKPVPGFRNFENHQIVIDPNNPQRVWVVYNTFVAQSEDGGNTWSRWRLPDARPAYALAVHSDDSQVVYVGTGGKYNSPANGTVYKTVDGGRTWKQTALAADKMITALVIHPSISDAIWAVTGLNESGSVYRSENGAAEWFKLDIGYEGANVHMIAIDPKHPLVMYMSGSFGLLKTVDGGLTWDGAGVTDRCHALALDSANPDIVYAATSNEPETAFFKSVNAGSSWTKTSLAGIGRLLTLTICPDNSGQLFAGSFDSGIYMSEDSGITWHDSGQGITANIVHDSSVDPAAPMEILVSSASGVFRRDSQNTWHRLSIEESFAVAHDPHDSRIIYAGQNYNLAKSIDSGASWTETGILDSQDEVTSVASIAVDPLNSQVLYIGIVYSRGNKGEVYKSVDGGQTLTPVLELTVPVNTVAISPNDSSVIYSGSGSFYASAFDPNGGVYRSNDSGSTWSDPLLPDVIVNAIQVDPNNDGILYAACGDSKASTGGLYKSVDGGQSWQDKSFVIDAVKDIKIDPQNSQKMYAATYSYGIFLSIDGGEQWTNIGLSDYVTNDVSYHRIAGTQTMQTSATARATTDENTSLVYAGTNSGVTGYTGSTIYGIIYKGDTTEVAYPAEAWLDVGLDTPFRALIWDTGHYLIAKPPVGDDYILNCQTDGFYDQITNIHVWSMAELNYDFHLKPGSLPTPGTDNSGGGGGGGCFIDSLR